MSELYKKSFRGYLIDHHSPDPPIVTLDKLDIDEYACFFKEANINNLMLYCKDHWGVTYYDSLVGKRHPGLKEDWITQIVPVLRKLGIEFNAYYCLEYDTYAVQAHPEWSIRKQDGSPLALVGRIPKWGMPCYETGYRDYVLTQLKEIVSCYQPDSLFLDIFGKSLCYCEHCKAKFMKEHGYELPETEEDLKTHNIDVVTFIEKCQKDMMTDILDAVKSIDPDLKVTINFAALYSKEIRDMLDYQFTEPWAGNWLSAAYARDTAIDQYPQLGPGDVSEVYNYRPQTIYTLAASQIAAQGCRVFMYSGSQHPDGTLEHEEAKRVGTAYREVEKFEVYLSDREIVADIGIIQSDTSASIKNSSSIVPNAIKRVRQGSAHRDALLGAMKLSDYAMYTWNVIPEQLLTAEKANRYKVLILPNVYHVSDTLKTVLEAYVANGGTLISSFETGLYDKRGETIGNYTLNDLYGCTFKESYDRYKDSAWGGYLYMHKDAIWQHVPDTYPPVGETRHQVALQEGKSLATFVDPAVEITDTTWVNWWCPPPSHVTNDPAVVENTYGKGRVLFAAFDLFSMVNKDFHLVKDMFRGILDKYIDIPNLFIDTDHRNLLGYVGYHRPKHDDIIIHQVSHMAELANGDAPPIEGGTLCVSKALNVQHAEIVYPTEVKLDVIQQDDFIQIELPALDIHHIIRLY